MVHRAPDSRLLTSLIDHEKEYAKHLAALFPASHAALAALSAYAAASPSAHPASPAQSIAAVVDVLASADDALQRYTHAIDAWRQQLVALKDLEDDLGAVLRDRDILVTRLLKASKSPRDSHRSSRLVATLGSASFSSLPSTSSATGSSPASTNAKLAQAQAELQACEAHLVSKERELDVRRITVARDGLGARCRALIDCGWVWGEMGKQGLRALQALSANGSSHAALKPFSTHANPAYVSDNSSLTPSQSASQIAARSVETSNESPTSKAHERVQPETELGSTSKSQARSTRANDDGDLTITLPPAHVISESALPTGIRAQPRPLDNGDPTLAANASTHTQPAPVPRRKRTKRPRRPPSQHIIEVSDEGSDEPPSTSNHHANANASPRTLNTPFPTTSQMHDSSSDDEHPTGSLQVVENDPFEVIRKSMLGSASTSALYVPTAPAARASAPDVRTSVVVEGSPSKAIFPGSISMPGQGQGQGAGIGMGPPPGSARRQRRTSMAFFGSLRGLFRKPRERERLAVEWDDGHSSPSPSSPNRTKTKVGGWVTRTDARIKSKGGEDSDEEVTTSPKRTGTGMTTTSVVRGVSGARLRKGRPGASVRENGSPHADVDGWITDTPSAGIDTSGTGRSRARRGTVKRKKTVADLRGSEQGHTDGEVDREHQSLARASNKAREKAPQASMPASTSGPTPVVEPVPTDARPTADPEVHANANPSTQPRRATTTTATSNRKSSSNAPPVHRRSASLSLMDAHVAIVPTSTSTQATTGGSMSWRKPPPEMEPPSRSTSSSQLQTQVQGPPSSRTPESQPKPNARRHLGNGHAKHVQNQSLMSIIADVTRQNQNEDKARSLDIPRAPGSVLREAERDREGSGVERGVNGRGHTRATSSPEDGGQSQGQGQGQRAIKLPLRSALRNASRTPSPSPAVVPVSEVRKQEVEEDRGRGVISASLRDSASISSYETGRESLDGEEREGAASPPPTSPSPSPSSPPALRSQSPALHARSHTPSPPPLLFTFPPPPVDPPPVRGGGTTMAVSIPSQSANLNPNPNPMTPNAAEPPGSPSSRPSTETPPVRRKSVRMSLQPTFSSTPPALYDEDGTAYAPWSKSFGDEKKRGSRGDRGDVWADSSDEDEAYSRARRMLSLVGRSGRT